jgi:hypothetical protein
MRLHGKDPAWYLLALLLCTGHIHCGDDHRESAKPDDSSILRRVGVMGASLSAGTANRGIKLAFYLDGAILPPHEIVDASSSTERS